MLSIPLLFLRGGRDRETWSTIRAELAAMMLSIAHLPMWHAVYVACEGGSAAENAAAKKAASSSSNRPGMLRRFARILGVKKRGAAGNVFLHLKSPAELGKLKSKLICVKLLKFKVIHKPTCIQTNTSVASREHCGENLIQQKAIYNMNCFQVNNLFNKKEKIVPL